MTLVVMGFIFVSAKAQKPAHKTGKITSRKKAPVKDTVIQNYKVCKDDKGYAICGETPGTANSTYSQESIYTPQYPAFETRPMDMILLPTTPVHTSYKIPYDQPGPDSQSGPWADVYGWNGIW